jgi:hypothetical protein
VEPIPLAALGLAFVALVLAVVALFQIRQANARLAEVTPDIRGLANRVRGKEGEEALALIFSQLEGVSRKMNQVEVQMSELDRVVSRALRRIGLVRFDANEDIRGDLSFALCALDNRDNGFIVSSIYTLENCRVFVRGVLGGKTKHDLMPEEAEALEQAMGER